MWNPVLRTLLRNIYRAVARYETTEDQSPVWVARSQSSVEHNTIEFDGERHTTVQALMADTYGSPHTAVDCGLSVYTSQHGPRYGDLATLVSTTYVSLNACESRVYGCPPFIGGVCFIRTFTLRSTDETFLTDSLDHKDR